MNGEVNCILGVCCPPGGEGQRAALTREMNKSLGSNGDCRKYADWMIDNFDLAPKGSLQPFKDEVARLAREGHTKDTP